MGAREQFYQPLQEKHLFSFEYGEKMRGCDVQLNYMDCLSACLLMCAHACLGKHMVFSGCPVAAGEIVLPFVFVQVFGDYYHFRHHAVEKRALSGHRGMHIRLQKEPQVRLVSALHSSLQHTMLATKVQNTDWITHGECVYHKTKRCQH